MGSGAPRVRPAAGGAGAASEPPDRHLPGREGRAGRGRDRGGLGEGPGRGPAAPPPRPGIEHVAGLPPGEGAERGALCPQRGGRAEPGKAAGRDGWTPLWRHPEKYKRARCGLPCVKEVEEVVTGS